MLAGVFVSHTAQPEELPITMSVWPVAKIHIQTPYIYELMILEVFLSRRWAVNSYALHILSYDLW